MNYIKYIAIISIIALFGIGMSSGACPAKQSPSASKNITLDDVNNSIRNVSAFNNSSASIMFLFSAMLAQQQKIKAANAEKVKNSTRSNAGCSAARDRTSIAQAAIMSKFRSQSPMINSDKIKTSVKMPTGSGLPT